MPLQAVVAATSLSAAFGSIAMGAYQPRGPGLLISRAQLTNSTEHRPAAGGCPNRGVMSH